MAESFRTTELDVIYSSPLKRAYDTAKAVAEVKNLDVHTDEGLKEINYGHWEGRTIEELTALYGDEHLNTLRYPGNDKDQFPGEGSLRNVLNRVIPVTNRIITANPDKTIMIVAHGGILKIMILYLLGLEIDHYNRIWMDNTGVSIIVERHETYMLTRLNDRSHLRGKKL